MKIRKLIPGWIKEWINYIGICEKIDDSISIAKNSKVYPGVTIGKYSYVNGNSYIFSGSIGRYCSFGYNVQIGPPEHPIHNFSLHPRFYKYWGGGYSDVPQPPIIESDVWIGSNSVVLQGVKIGVGAVVAAGAVVTKYVPPYAIVAGVPAKIIGFRFDERIISLLLTSQWWNKEPGEIENFDFVCRWNKVYKNI